MYIRTFKILECLFYELTPKKELLLPSFPGAKSHFGVDAFIKFFMNINIIQHVPFESPGHFIDIFESYKAHLSYLEIYREEPVIREDFDVLLIMGGPMNIYEEHIFPWLKEEKKIIGNAIENGKVIIGVCLGAQLIADALGSKVYPCRSREIGWFPVQKTNDRVLNFLPDYITVFHWHGETFDLPENCISFYKSDLTEHQAFLCNNRVLGLQFHLEMELEGAKALCKNCREEMDGTSYVMDEKEIIELYKKYNISNKKTLKNIVQWLFEKNLMH